MSTFTDNDGYELRIVVAADGMIGISTKDTCDAGMRTDFGANMTRAIARSLLLHAEYADKLTGSSTPDTHIDYPANARSTDDETLLAYIRCICSLELGESYDYEFFSLDYDECDTCGSLDEHLLEAFKRERKNHDEDRETVLVMCHG